MTETSQVWDGILTGDAGVVAPYSASEWAARQKLLHGQGTVFPNYGVLKGTGDGTYPPLQVQAKSPASTNIEVEIGAALVTGYLYQNTAALTFTIGANASGNPRIDTVILRVDFTAQTVRAVVKQGTPAGSPVAPSMQQDASLWEIPLANIAVANGFTVINQTDITNRQRAMHSLSAGWQHVANPLGYYAAANYDAATETLDPAALNAVAVPFALTGNMLLQQVDVRHITTAIAYTIDWGLFFEDLNDGNTAENTLRLLATGSASGNTVGTTTIVIPATPSPQVISPGFYWLVLRQAGGGVLKPGIISGANFDSIGWLKRTGTMSGAFPIPQTLDMVTNWGLGTIGSIAVRLRGRVFGKTTVP